MSAEITLYTEGQPARTVPLGAILSIGRGPGNDLVINDTRASRNHAVIRLQADKAYYLVDLGSANGTLLNGRRITIPSALKSGDEIQIANNRLEFVYQEEAHSESSANSDEMRTQIEFTSETISILVVDIRNFTVLSEKIAAEDLSRIVGKWFKEVATVIEHHGGTINKFIGDAVMAYWLKARTEGDKNYLLGPIRSALELIKLAKSFDSELSAIYPEFGFKIGCGINAGRAILGNVGVDAVRDITPVGDSVNVAFRLESLCKELGYPLIVSEEVQKEVETEFPFKDLGLNKVKGKSQELRVFTIEIS